MQQPELGKRIAELRKFSRLTQDELAKRCGFTVRTLQRIESGSVMPRKYTLSLISGTLGDSLDGSSKKSYLKRVYEGIQDLFNLKTYKMEKISFFSVVLLAMGSSVALFSTEANAQDQTRPAAQTTEQLKGFIVGDADYFGFDSIPPGEYCIINAAATGKGVAGGSASIIHRGDTFELAYGNLIYLNDDYFATVEKGDTILLPWKKTDQWVIRPHSPVEFPSISYWDSKVRYIAPEKPIMIGSDDWKSVYTFENGLEIRESKGQIFLNDDFQFDVSEGDTVVLDQQWEISLRKAK